MAFAAYERWKTQPVERPDVSIVVPTFNEARRILPTVGAIAAHLCERTESWELILADSGSSDGTPEMVAGLGFANVKVLTSDVRDGKGAGVRRGVLAARGDHVLFADADGSTPIEALDGMLTMTRAGSHDVVIASRAARDDGASRSLLRRTMSRGLQLLVRLALRLPVVDTQCGFKLFTGHAARRLFAAQTLDGFSFDMEILFLARKNGMRIAEIPVDWVDAPGSKVSPLKEVARFVRDLGKIRFNDLAGRYSHA